MARRINLNERVAVKRARFNKIDIALLTLKNKKVKDEFQGDIFADWDEKSVTVRVSKKTAISLSKVLKDIFK